MKHSEDYDQRISYELKRVALKSGLKEKDISFELEKIPGYEENAMYIRENVPEGSVCVINKKDYDELQKERKEISEPTGSGKHWVYRECVLWNEKTGICTDYILDYSE